MEKGGFVGMSEFVNYMCIVYCSNLEEKIKFTFQIYDFDKDG
jgi:Ca2+-binding EF-hand superfamily protein